MLFGCSCINNSIYLVQSVAVIKAANTNFIGTIVSELEFNFFI